MLLFAGAFVPRLLYVTQIETPPFSDMADYDRIAVRFLMGEGLMQSEQYRAYRPPGYPLFLASIYSVCGHSVRAVRVVQALLGALTPVLTFLLAVTILRNHPGKVWIGTLAGALVALSDESIFYCGQLLTETLYTFLFVLWITGLIWVGTVSNRRVRWAVFVGASLLHGYLMLIRPVAGILVPIAWWMFYRHSGRDWRRIVLYTALAMLVVLPWSVRNYRVTGRFVPLSTNGGVNFYIGHNAHFGYWSTGDKAAIREQTDLDEVDESALFFRLGMDFIRENPWQDFRHNVMKIGYLFTTTWKPWPWFNYGRDLRFPPLPTWIAWPWSWPVIVIIVAGLVVAVVKREDVAFLVLLCLGQVASCLIFFARARFRLPLIPILAVFMAYGIVVGVKRLLRYARPER